MRSLAHHGQDGASRWSAKAVTLGHQMRWISPESPTENLPDYQPQLGLAINTDARLANRETLFAQLSIPPIEQPRCSDSELILRAYVKWGINCAEYLIGDFALAVWDTGKRQLFLSRDHLGRRPLFYTHVGQQFLFASEVKGLTATSSVKKTLNPQMLAGLLTGRSSLLNEDMTYFQGIYGLPAATSMVVNTSGVRKWRYWQPQPAACDKLPYQRDDDILHALRDLIFEVIGARCRSAYPVGTLFSGGLDSSAVTGVAAACLQQQGQSLTAFSSISQPGADPLLDEKDYIDQFNHLPNLRTVYLNAIDGGPFDHLDALIWGYESPAASSRHFIYSACAKLAQSMGVRLILDGIGGELGPTAHATGFYSQLLLQGRWQRLTQELKSRHRLTGDSGTSMIKTLILKPLLPASFLNLPGQGVSPTLSMVEENHYLQATFVKRQLAGLKPDAHRINRRLSRISPYSARNIHRHLLHTATQSRIMGFPGYQNIEICSPLLDKRILEFCLAIPNRLRVHKGYDRYPIRGALGDLLPEKIRWRNDKKPFSPDFHLRYNAQRPWAQQFLASIQKRDPVREIVDIDKLIPMVSYDISSDRTSHRKHFTALHTIPQSIYLIYFLRQFTEFSM